jgi:hypothetical protein
MVLKAGRPVTDDTAFTITPDTEDSLCRDYERLKARGDLDPRFAVPVRRPWALEFRVQDPFGQKIVISIPDDELKRNEIMRSEGRLPPRATHCEVDVSSSGRSAALKTLMDGRLGSVWSGS